MGKPLSPMHQSVLDKARDLLAVSGTLYPELSTPKASPVWNGIWVGSGLHAQDRRFLREEKIGAILNLAPRHVPTGPMFYAHTMRYHEMNLIDASEFDIQHFADEANQYIEHCVAEGKSVLIHCAMGVSRAPTVAMMYLIKQMTAGSLLVEQLASFRGETFSSDELSNVRREIEKKCQSVYEKETNLPVQQFLQLLAHLLTCRPVIEPNQGFLEQLWDYQSSLEKEGK